MPRGGANSGDLDAGELESALGHGVSERAPSRRLSVKREGGGAAKKRPGSGGPKATDSHKKRKVESSSSRQSLSSVNAALDSTDYDIENEIQTIEVIPCTLDEAIAEALGRPVKFEKDWSDRSIAGTPCKVFWSTDNVWYGGRILFLSRDEKCIFVHYDDGMTEWVDIKTESVLLGLGLVVHRVWPAQRFWLSELGQQNFPKMNKGIYIEYVGEKMEHAYVKDTEITNFFSANSGSRIKNFNMAVAEIERKRFIVRSIAEKVRALILKRLCGEDLVGIRIRVSRDDLVRAVNLASRRGTRSHRDSDDMYETTARSKARRRQETDDGGSYDSLPEYLTGTIIAANIGYSKYYIAWDDSSGDPLLRADTDIKEQLRTFSTAHLPRWLGLHDAVRSAEVAPPVDGMIDVAAQVDIAFDMPVVTSTSVDRKNSIAEQESELPSSAMFRCCGLCRGASFDAPAVASDSHADDTASLSDDGSVNDRDRLDDPAALVSCSKCRQSYHSSCMPPVVTPYPIVSGGKEAKRSPKDKRAGDEWTCWFCTECAECKVNVWEKQIYNVDLKELISSYDRTFRVFAGAKRECQTNRLLCVGCVDKYSLLKKEYCPICLETYPSDNELKQRDAADLAPIMGSCNASDSYMATYCKLNDYESSNTQKSESPVSFVVPKYLSQALPVIQRLKSYSDTHAPPTLAEIASKRKSTLAGSSTQRRGGAGDIQSPVKKRMHSTLQKSKFGELMQQSSEECKISAEKILDIESYSAIADKNQSEDMCDGMVECNDCGRWVHAKCEAINEAAFEAIGNCTHPVWGDEYLCPKCRYNAFTTTLNKLEDRDVYNLFAAPVNEALAPGYSELIRYPMDLATMRTKIETGVYKSMQTLRQDFELICANAVKFNKRGDPVWKASVVFFLRGSDVLSKTRVSQLSLYGQEVLKMVTAEEIQQTILKSLSKPQIGDKEKKEPEQKLAENKSKQPKTKLAALANERYQPPKWLASWLESELQPKIAKEMPAARNTKPSAVQLQENVYARVATSYRSSSSRRRGDDPPQTATNVSSLFVSDGGPAASATSSAAEATALTTMTSRVESNNVDPMIMELSKFPKLVPFAAVTEFVRSTINSVSHEIAHFDCARDVCLVCGSGGASEASKLIFCCDCGEAYHSYCVFPANNESGRIERVIDREWRCMNCSRCDECFSDCAQGSESRADEYIYCDSCDKAFHLSCITPKLHVIPEFSWYCKHCVQCSSCASGLGPDYFGESADGLAAIHRGRVWGKCRDICIACTVGNRVHPSIESSVICKIIDVIDTPRSCFECNRSVLNKSSGLEIPDLSAPDSANTLYCTFCFRVQHLECYKKFVAKLRLQYSNKIADIRKDFAQAARNYCQELQKNYVCSSCRPFVQKRRGPDAADTSKYQVLHVRQARLFYTILKRMSEGHFRASRFRLKLFESIIFCRTVTMWALSIVREAPQILPFVFKAFVGPSALYARSKVSRVPTWSLQRAARFIDIVRGEYGTRMTPSFQARQLQMLNKVLQSDWVQFDATLIDEMQWRLEDLALLFKICGLAASFMWVMFRLLRFDSSPILKAAYVRWASPSGPAYKVLGHGLSVKGRALAPSVGNAMVSDEHATLANEVESKVRLKVSQHERKSVSGIDDVEAEAKLFRYSNEVCVSNITSILRRFLEPSPIDIVLSPSLGHNEAQTQDPESAQPTGPSGSVPVNTVSNDQSASNSIDPNRSHEGVSTPAAPNNESPNKPTNDFNSCLSDELVSVFFKDKAVRVKLEQFIVSVLMPPAGLGKTITENGIKTRREIVAELREPQIDPTTERLSRLSVIDDIVDIDNFYFSNLHSTRDMSLNAVDPSLDVSTTSWDIYTIMMTGLRGPMKDCCAWWFDSSCSDDSNEIRDPMLAEIRNVLALKSVPEVVEKKKTPNKKRNKVIIDGQRQVAESTIQGAGGVASNSFESAVVLQGNYVEIPPSVSGSPSAAGASEASAETKKRTISKLRDLIEPVTNLVSPDRCHVIVNGAENDVALTGWETHPGQAEVWEDFRRCAFCNGSDAMPNAKLHKFYNLNIGEPNDSTSIKIESDEIQRDGDGVASSAYLVTADHGELASSDGFKYDDINAASIVNETQVFEVEIAPMEGRLITLPYFSSEMRYAHANCLRYSSGVHETSTGELRGTAKALAFADATICSFCNQLGASLKCDANRCKKVFHLRCGIVSGCFSLTGRWKTFPEQIESVSSVAKNPGIISATQEAPAAKAATATTDSKPIVRKKKSQVGSQSKKKKVSLSLPPTEIINETTQLAGQEAPETADAHLSENYRYANQVEEETRNSDAAARVGNGGSNQDSMVEVPSDVLNLADEEPLEEQASELVEVMAADIQEDEPAQFKEVLENPLVVESMSEHGVESSGRAKREVKPKVHLDAYAGRLPSSRQKPKKKVAKATPKLGTKAVKRPSASTVSNVAEKDSSPAQVSAEIEAQTSLGDTHETETAADLSRTSRYINQSAELMRKCKEHSGELRVLIDCNDHSSNFEKDWVPLMTPPMEPCREITIEPKDWLPAVLAEGSSSISDKKKFAIARLLKDGRAAARIGSLTIHDIGQPVVDSIWFNDGGVIYPPGFCATKLHWSYIRPGQRTLFQFEILSSRNFEHLFSSGDDPIIADTLRPHFPVFRLTALDDPSLVYLSLTIEDCYVWLRKKIYETKDAFSNSLQSASIDVIRNLSSKIESNSRFHPKFGFKARGSSGCSLTDVAVKLAALRFFGLGLEVVHRAIEMSPESVAAMMPNLFLWGTGYLDEVALVSLQKKLDFFSQKIVSTDSDVAESLRIIASRRDAAYAPSFLLPQKNAAAELLRLVSAGRKSIVPKITCSKAMSFIGGKLNASEEFEVDGASILNKVADVLQSSRSSSSGTSSSTSFSRAMKRATKTDVEEEEPAGLAELLAEIPDDGSMPASERLQARLEKDYWVMQRNNSTDMGSFLAASKSAIHGWGLYAQRDFPANSMLIEYIGEEIRHTVADRREAEYERQMGLTGSCYLFRLDKDSVIDATHTGGMARFLNHCCEPNSYAYIISTRTRPSQSIDVENSSLMCQPVGAPVKEQKHIVIMASRQIKAGEEITYDYKFPIEEDNKLPCLCGALFCRGSMN